MAAVNIFTAQGGNGRVDVGQELGSSATAMFIYDVQPGRRSSPYHYEYEEEWLLVVEGSVVRTGGTRRVVFVAAMCRKAAHGQSRPA